MYKYTEEEKGSLKEQKRKEVYQTDEEGKQTYEHQGILNSCVKLSMNLGK